MSEGSPRITYRVTERFPKVDDDTLVSIRSGYLPLFYWPWIPVKREKSIGITSLDRLMLEAAIRFGEVEIEDILQVTRIPRRAVRRIANRLVSAGALSRLPDEAAFTVNEVKAEEILRSGDVKEPVEDTLTFLYLPRTDDIVTFKESARFPHRFCELNPALLAPVPPEARDKHKYEFLAERVRLRSVVNLPDDVVEIMIPTDDDMITPICNAYEFSGKITSGQDREKVDITLYSAGGGGSSKERLQLDLTGATGFIDWCKSLTSHMDSEFGSAHASAAILQRDDMHAPMRRLDQSSWAIELDEQAAMAVSGSRSLASPVELVADSDEELVINIAVHFLPRDDPALQFFALDETVEQITKSSEAMTGVRLEDIIDECLRKHGAQAEIINISPRRVMERLWELKRYQYVYEIREEGDFHHA